MKRNILLTSITCFILTLAAVGQTPTPEYSETEDPKTIASPTPTPPTPVTVEELQRRAKAAKIKDVTITYDRFKDQSVIATKPHNLIGSNEGAMAIVARGMLGPAAGPAQTMLMMTFGYQFKGTALTTTPERYAILFSSTSSGWVFLKGDQNLYILFDNERLELSPSLTDHDIQWRVFDGPGVSETVGFAVTRADLERLLAASRIEVKLGDTKPRKWKPDWSKRIRALLSLTDLSK